MHNATQKISARILALVAAGKDIRSAVDEVLGAGTSAKIAGDLYDALRAKR
jgi:DNA integrity scanning protein DisA with diadenylate cyclase activity